MTIGRRNRYDVGSSNSNNSSSITPGAFVLLTGACPLTELAIDPEPGRLRILDVRPVHRVHVQVSAVVERAAAGVLLDRIHVLRSARVGRRRRLVAVQHRIGE